MQGFELDTAMRADAHATRHFCGVFAADTLPRQLDTLPALLIANTDCSHLSGQHWVAFHVDKNGRGEFFDSYGRAPFVRAHRQFLNRVCTKWVHNPTRLQDLGGTVCGQYCITYLLYKAHQRSLNEYVSDLFTNDTNMNGLIVSRLYKQYSKCVKRCLSDGKKNTQTCCALKML